MAGGTPERGRSDGCEREESSQCGATHGGKEGEKKKAGLTDPG